ncbi:head-tail adaptor protein [Pseudoxanthobacter sp.]|uniref:phage head completion protein n=1 Tax=Pseudoxanthobacter sp. TaxID=1925742 RepID=UPI002FE3E1EC
MSAGALRARLTFVAADGAPDGGGGTGPGERIVAVLWAAVQPAAAAERSMAGRLDGVVTHRIRIRANAGIGGGLTARLGTRRLRILAGYDEDGRGRYRILLAEEEGR